MRTLAWTLLGASVALLWRLLALYEPIPPEGHIFRSDSPDGSFIAHVGGIGFVPFAMPGQGSDTDARLFLRDRDGWIVAMRDFAMLNQWYDTDHRSWICTEALGCRRFEMRHLANVMLPKTDTMSIWDKAKHHAYWLSKAALLSVPCDGEPENCPAFSIPLASEGNRIRTEVVR